MSLQDNEMYHPALETHDYKSVEFYHIEGVRFDIYEVAKHDVEARKVVKSCRFFVACEGRIHGFEHAEGYFESTGECRWDLFCADKSTCKGRIMDYLKKSEEGAKILTRCKNMKRKNIAPWGFVDSLFEIHDWMIANFRQSTLRSRDLLGLMKYRKVNPVVSNQN